MRNFHDPNRSATTLHEFPPKLKLPILSEFVFLRTAGFHATSKRSEENFYEANVNIFNFKPFNPNQ